MKHRRANISDSVQNVDSLPADDVSQMKPVVERPDHVPDRREVRRRKRINGLAGVFTVLFLVAAVAGVGAFLYNDMQTRAETQRIVEQREREAAQAKEEAQKAAEEQAAQQRRDALHAVSFSVSGVDYDQYATRIPLQVTGDSVAGQAIDELVFVDYQGVGLSLPAGTYTAVVAASPMASTGMIYTVSTPAMEFTIDETDSDAVASGQAIVLIPIEADRITQEDIDNAYAWAVKDSQSSIDIKAIKKAAETAMVESKERKQKASAEERRRRAQEFASEYFTTVMFVNQDDDSKTTAVANWTDVVMAYVRDGTKLAEELKKGPGTTYSAAQDVRAPTSDDKAKTVTVSIKVARTDKLEKGWTDKTSDATMVCAFDDDNMITKIKVTTEKGTKEI